MKKILPFIILLCSTSLMAQTVTVGSTTLTERVVATGLVIPWEIIWGPDDFIWSTERTGVVRRINPNTGNMVTVLDLSSDIAGGASNEPGLLGMALHPDFLTTSKVYLVYNYFSGGSVKEKLVSYDWNGTSLMNETVLLGNISGANIHNGSRLMFLPDGTL
ncbi:MAG: PQQ-dependent sugar dehydrogenase, partial [Saprospiraceae bacterium]